MLLKQITKITWLCLNLFLFCSVGTNFRKSTTIDTMRPNVTEVRAAIVYNLFHQHWTNTSGENKKTKRYRLVLNLFIRFKVWNLLIRWIFCMCHWSFYWDKNDEWVSDRLFEDWDHKWKNKSIKIWSGLDDWR